MPDKFDTIAQRPTPNAQRLDSCPKFSIVIPVYNTEKYIARCIDSLVNQDIPERNYEIIITDDGSSDSSGKICDSYAAEYPFIHVTHTENHGPSHARNIALEKCRGEYVMFCDSDDFVSPQLISVLTKAAEVFGSPDMMIYDHFCQSLPGNGWPVYNIGDMNESDSEFFTAEEVCINIFLPGESAGGYLWDKLVKRELLQAIRFDENMRILEDEKFWLEILTRNKDMGVCRMNYSLYCYVQREKESITCDSSSGNLAEYIRAREKMLNVIGLYERITRTIKSAVFFSSVSEAFSGSHISPNGTKNTAVYKLMRGMIGKYARDFYTNSEISYMFRIKQVIKHILVLLHIHKPRRK